jgi:hypothetical protein
VSIVSLVAALVCKTLFDDGQTKRLEIKALQQAFSTPKKRIRKPKNAFTSL